MADFATTFAAVDKQKKDRFAQTFREVEQAKENEAWNTLAAEGAVYEPFFEKIEQAELAERELFSKEQLDYSKRLGGKVPNMALYDEALNYADDKTISKMDDSQRWELVKENRAKRAEMGYKFLPVDKKKLMTGGYSADGKPVFNGPTIRAANATYLAGATGMEVESAAVLYDSLVTGLWGDKEPNDIKPLGKLIRKWYSDKRLIESGIYPEIYRAAQRYAAGDNTVDWDIVRGNLSREKEELFNSYISQMGRPKQRGVFGKTAEVLKRSIGRSAQNITDFRTLVVPEKTLSQPIEQMKAFSEFKAREGREPTAEESLLIMQEATSRMKERVIGRKKSKEALEAGDPVKGESIPGKLFYGTLSIAPDVLASAGLTIAAKSPVASFQYWYMLTATDIYTDMADLGFEDEAATNTAKILALPVAAVEFLQAGQWTKGLTGAARKKAVAKAQQGLTNYLAGKLKGGLVNFGKEYGQEIQQSGLKVAGMAFASSLTEDAPDVNWWDDVISPEIGGLGEALWSFPGLTVGFGAAEIGSEAKMVRRIMKDHPGIDAATARAAVYNAKSGAFDDAIEAGLEAKQLIPFTVEELNSRVEETKAKLTDLSAMEGGQNSELLEYTQRRLAILKDGGDRGELAASASRYGIDEDFDEETAEQPFTTEGTEEIKGTEGKMGAEYRDAVVGAVRGILEANGIAAQIRAVENIELPEGAEGQQAAAQQARGAFYFDGDGAKVIQLAFAYNENRRPADITTAGHESYHALAELLTDEERAAVAAQFGENEDMQAEGFGVWLGDRVQGRGDKAGGIVSRAFERIAELLKKIYAALKKEGLTYKSVFEGVAAGELKGRTSNIERSTSNVESGRQTAGSILYHGTDNAESILKNGFTFKSRNFKGERGEFGNSISLSPDKNFAKIYGKDVIEIKLKPNIKLFENEGYSVDHFSRTKFHDRVEELESNGISGEKATETAIDELKEQDYGGIKTTYDSGKIEITIFNPKDIQIQKVEQPNLATEDAEKAGLKFQTEDDTMGGMAGKKAARDIASQKTAEAGKGPVKPAELQRLEGLWDEVQPQVIQWEKENPKPKRPQDIGLRANSEIPLDTPGRKVIIEDIQNRLKQSKKDWEVKRDEVVNNFLGGDLDKLQQLQAEFRFSKEDFRKSQFPQTYSKEIKSFRDLGLNSLADSVAEWGRDALGLFKPDWYAHAKYVAIKIIKENGGIQTYKSNKGESGSIYFKMPSGQEIRISDHELPEHRAGLNEIPNWDEIILDKIIPVQDIIERTNDILGIESSFNHPAPDAGGQAPAANERGEVKFQIDTQPVSKLEASFRKDAEEYVANVYIEGADRVNAFIEETRGRAGQISNEMDKNDAMAEVDAAKAAADEAFAAAGLVGALQGMKGAKKPVLVNDAKGVYKGQQQLAIEAGIRAKAAVDKALYQQQARPKRAKYLDGFANRFFGHLNDAKRLAGRGAAKSGKQAKKTFEYLAVPIANRLEAISPTVFQQVLYTEYKIKTRTAAMAREAVPLLEKLNRFQKDNTAKFDDFAIAWRDGDFTEADRIAERYGFADEFTAVRAVLNEIFAMANRVGMEIRYAQGYGPRHITDIEGFMEAIGGTEAHSQIAEAIRNAEKKKGRQLEADERLRLINTLIRGYTSSGIALSRAGHAKERGIENTSELGEFYASPQVALMHYITEMNEKVSWREFFGKETKDLVNLRGEKSRLLTRLNALSGKTAGKVFLMGKGFSELNEIDYAEHIKSEWKKLDEVSAKITVADQKSLSESVASYVDEKYIRPSEAAGSPGKRGEDLASLLQALIEPKSVSDRNLKFLRDLGYITTLANPFSAMTQLKDIGVSAYRDIWGFLPQTIKAAVNKGELNLEDIGAALFGEELTAESVGRAVAASMKYSGFAYIDRLGKTTYINTVINKYRRESAGLSDADISQMAAGTKKKSETFERVERFFGDKTSDVVKEIRDGGITDNIKFLAFAELADVQPIAMSSMPAGYARAGNLRLMYMMKSFTIRQINWIYRESIKEMGSKKTFARGAKRLIQLAITLEAFNIGIEVLRQLAKGKEPDEIDIADIAIDEAMGYMMASRYSVQNIRREGFAGYMKQVAPPTKPFDWIVQGKPDKAVRNIPILGEPYYWWFGAGSEKK